MSFSRLNNDTKAYQKEINESVGPGKYQLGRPAISCEPCYQVNPEIRIQSVGASVHKDRLLIDIDSELIGLTRKQTKDPEKKRYNNEGDNDLKNFQDCYLASEPTKLSNPPCNLRGTGWNRWEWLCQNPQDKVEIPFNWKVDTRLLSKDNHKPCIPTPLDHTNLIPNINNQLKKEKLGSTYGVPTHGKQN